MPTLFQAVLARGPWKSTASRDGSHFPCSQRRLFLKHQNPQILGDGCHSSLVTLSTRGSQSGVFYLTTSASGAPHVRGRGSGFWTGWFCSLGSKHGFGYGVLTGRSSLGCAVLPALEQGSRRPGSGLPPDPLSGGRTLAPVQRCTMEDTPGPRGGVYYGPGPRTIPPTVERPFPLLHIAWGNTDPSLLVSAWSCV